MAAHEEKENGIGEESTDTNEGNDKSEDSTTATTQPDEDGNFEVIIRITMITFYWCIGMCCCCCYCWVVLILSVIS